MIHVAVGVIRSPDQRILISRRPPKAHQGDLWEFPGGKVESGETVQQALHRELSEELDLQTVRTEPLCRVSHDYGDRRVLLDVWTVREWRGTPRGMEDQPLRWVPVDELDPQDFPVANRPIIRCLRLHDLLAITPAADDAQQALRQLRHLAAHHEGLIQLRQPALDADAMDRVLEAASQLPGQVRRRILLNIDPKHPLCSRFGGCHLNSRRLGEFRERPVAEDLLLGASCHTIEELAMAMELGADYATLSPVQETASHPGAVTLGWERFAEMLKGMNLPVYAQGGLGRNELDEARRHGARGVAGIRFLQ
ncbi:MAG: Nudix family hydrolase [Pseudohongiellaceae bacterium]